MFQLLYLWKVKNITFFFMCSSQHSEFKQAVNMFWPVPSSGAHVYFEGVFLKSIQWVMHIVSQRTVNRSCLLASRLHSNTPPPLIFFSRLPFVFLPSEIHAASPVVFATSDKYFFVSIPVRLSSLIQVLENTATRVKWKAVGFVYVCYRTCLLCLCVCPWHPHDSP